MARLGHKLAINKVDGVEVVLHCMTATSPPKRSMSSSGRETECHSIYQVSTRGKPNRSGCTVNGAFVAVCGAIFKCSNRSGHDSGKSETLFSKLLCALQCSYHAERCISQRNPIIHSSPSRLFSIQPLLPSSMVFFADHSICFVQCEGDEPS